MQWACLSHKKDSQDLTPVSLTEVRIQMGVSNKISVSLMFLQRCQDLVLREELRASHITEKATLSSKQTNKNKQSTNALVFVNFRR
jgi:hypothetical protein